jgi:hypothetical protein
MAQSHHQSRPRNDRACAILPGSIRGAGPAILWSPLDTFGRKTFKTNEIFSLDSRQYSLWYFPSRTSSRLRCPLVCFLKAKFVSHFSSFSGLWPSGCEFSRPFMPTYVNQYFRFWFASSSGLPVFETRGTIFLRFCPTAPFFDIRTRLISLPYHCEGVFSPTDVILSLQPSSEHGRCLPRALFKASRGHSWRIRYGMIQTG